MKEQPKIPIPEIEFHELPPSIISAYNKLLELMKSYNSLHNDFSYVSRIRHEAAHAPDEYLKSHIHFDGHGLPPNTNRELIVEGCNNKLNNINKSAYDLQCEIHKYLNYENKIRNS